MIFLAGMQKMSGRVTSEVAALATSAIENRCPPLVAGCLTAYFSR